MNDEERRLERIGGKLVHKGPIAAVRMDRFRYPDGGTDVRQVVVHPGAVAILAHDGKVLYMVRQPREPVEEVSLLELPAGKLDREGEAPLQCAQRELSEEIGKAAGDWRELKSFYTSPGFATERVHLFLATELYEAPGDEGRPGDSATRGTPVERIEVVEVALDQLEQVIESCSDAKSLVGLMLLQRML